MYEVTYLDISFLVTMSHTCTHTHTCLSCGSAVSARLLPLCDVEEKLQEVLVKARHVFYLCIYFFTGG